MNEPVPEKQKINFIWPNALEQCNHITIKIKPIVRLYMKYALEFTALIIHS